jgi:HSP20 family protein
MAIIKYEPFRGFEGIARKMNDFVNSFDTNAFSGNFANFVPKVDISEDEVKLYIQAEIPGLNKEDFKVTINDDNLLIIKGSKKREEKTEEDNSGRTFIRIERGYGEFTRSFILPDNVNKESIQAKFDNGVLNLTLDKIEPQKPKEVEISIS